MFQALMRGVGETRTPLMIVLGTVVLNFLLDPLFIFGLGPRRMSSPRARSLSGSCAWRGAE
jgi:Na+-driven multidrug efflux pump